MLIIFDDIGAPTTCRFRATTTVTGEEAETASKTYSYHAHELYVQPDRLSSGSQLSGDVKPAVRDLTSSKSTSGKQVSAMWTEVKGRAEILYAFHRSDIGELILIDEASLDDAALAGKLEPLRLKDMKTRFHLETLDEAAHQDLWRTLSDVARTKGPQPWVDPKSRQGQELVPTSYK
jgi:hypothetical protein